MSVSLYQSCIPVYERSLKALSAIIDKAEAHADCDEVRSGGLCDDAAAPRHVAFARQVQTVCDNAKNAAARLAGVEPPPFEDNETTLDELKTRIQKTLDVLAKTIDPAAFEAGAGARSSFPLGPNKAKMLGADYLAAFRAAELLFPSRHRLRHPALRRRRRSASAIILGATPGVATDLSISSRKAFHEHSANRRRPAHVAGGRPRRHDLSRRSGRRRAGGPERRRADDANSRDRSTSCWPKRAPTRRGCCRRRSISPTSRRFAKMNAVWDAWVAKGAHAGPRDGRSETRRAGNSVEIACIAAKP